MANGPNPLKAAWSMLRARRLRSPRPKGTGTADHSVLGDVLLVVRDNGTQSLVHQASRLRAYGNQLASIDPDDLSRDEALAYWINLYNAGALHVAAQAFSAELDSVLRIPGAFSSPWVVVAGETVTLDDIEHGKIRRFGDPRIHGALICGSVSCPTLRNSPFTGNGLDTQLDDQMRSFLASGGARLDRHSDTIHLTRVLKWYGGDFVRPASMPTLIPASGRTVAQAVRPWLEPSDAEFVASKPLTVVFADYDWGLGCSIA